MKEIVNNSKSKMLVNKSFLDVKIGNISTPENNISKTLLDMFNTDISNSGLLNNNPHIMEIRNSIVNGTTSVDNIISFLASTLFYNGFAENYGIDTYHVFNSVRNIVNNATTEGQALFTNLELATSPEQALYNFVGRYIKFLADISANREEAINTITFYLSVYVMVHKYILMGIKLDTIDMKGDIELSALSTIVKLNGYKDFDILRIPLDLSLIGDIGRYYNKNIISRDLQVSYIKTILKEVA